MDIIFKCTSCGQELEVDAAGAGSEINCPTCNTVLTIPDATPDNASIPTPVGKASAPSAPQKVEKHFAVPQRKAPDVLIKKPNVPLEVAAKESDRKIRVKTIRHGDCIEVGKDKFDETITEFLQKVGYENVISITPVNYSHTDAAGRNLVQDYGVMIVFKA